MVSDNLKYNFIIPGFLGALTALYIVNPIIFLLFMFPFMMLFVGYLGNLMQINYKPNFKKIIISIIIFLIVLWIEYSYSANDLFKGLNTLVISITGFTFIVMTFLTSYAKNTFQSIADNFQILKQSFSNYFIKPTKLSLVAIVLEISLLYYILKFPDNNILKYASFVFWGISAYLLIILRGTNYLIKEDVENSILLLKLFGYSRITYYIIPLLHLTFEIPYWLFSIYFLLIYLGAIYFLYPYIDRPDKVRDYINVLKYINKNKKVKINKISRELEMENKYVNRIVKQLKSRFYVYDENKKYYVTFLYNYKK